LGEQLELEGIAQRVRKLAGVEEDETVSSLTIARRVLGVPVRVLPTLPTQACLVWDHDRYRILIRRLEREAHFAVAHELGHWALRELEGVAPADEEALANRFAGALCAPTHIVRAITKGRRSHHFRPLAKATGLSETAAALRLREVRGDSLAVVTANQRNIMGGFAGLDHDRAVRLADQAERDPRIAVVRLRGGIDEGRVQLYEKPR
jgi:hypothetical protein